MELHAQARAEAQARRHADAQMRSAARRAQQFQAQASRAQAAAQVQAARAHAHAVRLARGWHAHVHRQASQAALRGSSTAMVQHGGQRVEVRNGVVIVNGEVVAEARGPSVSVTTVNGQVSVNGQVVWPRPGGGYPPARGTEDAERVRGGAGVRPMDPWQWPLGGAEGPTADDGGAAVVLGILSRAMEYSVPGIQGARKPRAELEEPCAICLEAIDEGAQTRTLPCFHSFHRHCAEDCFRAQAAQAVAAGGSGLSAAVLCPVCRHAVGPDIVDLID